MNRYSRNMSTLTPEENQRLSDFKVCIAGCGALGEYICEMLGRLGIGSITVVDPDIFTVSNLNRQIYSYPGCLGEKKVMIARQRMALVNPDINLNALDVRLDRNNAAEILAGHDVVVDALDNLETRMVLQEAAESMGIPLVHGAIAGWFGQVSTIFPGDRTLNKIYSREVSQGVEQELGNPPFTPALVASIQVSEVVKILIGRGEILRGKMLYIDTLEQEYMVLPLGRDD